MKDSDLLAKKFCGRESPEHVLEDLGAEEREDLMAEVETGKRRVGISGKPIRKPFLSPEEWVLVVGILSLVGFVLFAVWYWPVPDLPFLKK